MSKSRGNVVDPDDMIRTFGADAAIAGHIADAETNHVAGGRIAAKGHRPDIFVLSRAADLQNESKLLRAGASRVVCPYNMGGARMAQILKKPTVVDFLDTAMMSGDLGLKLEEAVVQPTSHLVGKTIMTSNLRRDFGVIIVAIKKADNEMIFNPGPQAIIDPLDVIVAIGKQEDMQRMRRVLA